MATTHLDPARLHAGKNAYTTRRIKHRHLATLIGGDVTPQSGDLVLARVVEIGQHARVERPDGRKSQLFLGDEVLIAYGNRYATSQFEAHVPPDLQPCHLVAGGGVAARAESWHTAMVPPTVIRPVGLVGDVVGQVVNLRSAALPLTRPMDRPRTIAIVGTSMDSGKTTAAAYLVRGLTAAGRRVGAAKMTGTGAGKDLWLMRDAGARLVCDFVDAGHPSTYMLPHDAVLDISRRLIGHLAQAAMETIVVEIADGLYQQETRALLQAPEFRSSVDAILFAAGDALGAKAGVSWLNDHHLPVRGLTGLLTASPLAIEEARAAIDVPVFDLEALASPDIDALLEAPTFPIAAVRESAA